jgi:stage V sporulation protein B
VGKVVVTYVLVGIHSVNIMGAAFGTMFAYSFAMLLNAWCVKKYTGLTYSFTLTYLRPGLAALGMAMVTWLVYHGVFGLLTGDFLGFEGKPGPGIVDAGHPVGANMLATTLAILVAMVVYVVLIFAVKAVRYEELDQIPGGGLLKRIVGKVWKRGNAA